MNTVRKEFGHSVHRDDIISKEIIPMIKKLAKKNDLSVIDLHTAMDGMQGRPLKALIMFCASFMKSALYFQLNDLLSFVPSLIAYLTGDGINDDIISKEIIPMIKKLAKKNDLSVIVICCRLFRV